MIFPKQPIRRRLSNPIAYLLARLIVFLSLAIALLANAGCSWEADGKRTFLVLGLGVIETQEPINSINRVEAQHVKGIGGFVGPGPVVNGFMLGVTEHQSVRVDPASDITVDAWTTEDGSFRVQFNPTTSLLLKQ